MLSRTLCFVLLFSVYLTSHASMCASVGAGDVLVLNTTPVGECETLIVLSASEWAGSSIYVMPSVQEMTDFWAVGFVVPMSLFLFSWGVGSVIRLWRLPDVSS